MVGHGVRVTLKGVVKTSRNLHRLRRYSRFLVLSIYFQSNLDLRYLKDLKDLQDLQDPKDPEDLTDLSRIYVRSH
jgi:hypothetical protein